MKHLARLAAAVLALILLGASHARAIAILDFGRLNVDDEATYVSNLVEGAAKYLRAHGHPEQAQKAIDLFKNSTKQGGVSQLAVNVKLLQDENTRNQQNPNNRVPVYDVETAMQQTLADNGIIVPVAYLKSINRGFQPFFPLRSHIGGT
jgi:hypothetical protein